MAALSSTGSILLGINKVETIFVLYDPLALPWEFEVLLLSGWHLLSACGVLGNNGDNIKKRYDMEATGASALVETSCFC
jgi:hypothetical protein